MKVVSSKTDVPSKVKTIKIQKLQLLILQKMILVCSESLGMKNSASHYLWLSNLKLIRNFILREESFNQIMLDCSLRWTVKYSSCKIIVIHLSLRLKGWLCKALNFLSIWFKNQILLFNKSLIIMQDRFYQKK